MRHRRKGNPENANIDAFSTLRGSRPYIEQKRTNMVQNDENPSAAGTSQVTIVTQHEATSSQMTQNSFSTESRKRRLSSAKD
jgi:hypothetical protein